MQSSATIRVVALFLAYLLNVIILRYFSKQEAGFYFSHMAIVAIIVSIFTGGLTRYIVREVSSQKSNSLEKRIYFDSLTFSIYIFLAAFFFFYVEEEIYIFFIPLMVMLSLLSSLLRAEGRLILGNIESQLLRPFLIILIILVAQENSNLYYATLYALLISLISIQVLYLFKKKWTNTTKSSKRNYSMQSIVRLSTFAIIDALYLNIDMIIISSVAGGEFAAEYKVALLFRSLVLLPLSIALMVYPHLVASGINTDIIERQYKNLFYFIAFGSGAINLLVGDKIFGHIFGHEYTSVSSIVWPFVIMALIIAKVGFSVERLIVLGKERWVMYISILFIFVHSISIITLIPKFGLMAATISSAASYAGIYFASYLVLKNEKNCCT